MYRLHYWPTPNGHKITMMLEELGAPYEIVPVNIRTGDQFRPEFLKISPNNRMPALEDLADGVHIFESGAILLYLADKHERFIQPARHAQGRAEVLQWLFWQMAGLGPMLGQANHFRNYAPEKIPYAIERYTNESLRLLGVMDRCLEDRAYLAGEEYSIADIACYSWASSAAKQFAGEHPLSNIARWSAAIAERPATVRAFAVAARPEFQQGEATEEQKRMLFQQGLHSVRK